MPAPTHDIHPGDSSNKNLTDCHSVSIAAAVYRNTKCNIREHIDAEQVVDRANQLFGFDGWSSEICEAKTDFVRSAMFYL